MSEQLDFSRAVRINPGEHDLIARNNLHGVYQLPLSPDRNAHTVGSVGEIVEDGKVTHVSLIVPSVVADTLPWPHEGIKARIDEETNDMYYTAFGSEESAGILRTNRQKQVSRLGQKSLQHSSFRALLMSTDTAAALMESYLPEEIFMFSGAGIGAANVWTHQTAARRAGFIMQPQTPAEYAQNKVFAKDFLDDYAASVRVKHTFDTLERQRSEALPTDAHYAFSGIVKRLGDKSLVATTSTTYAHEQTGLVVPWVTREQQALATLETGHGAAFAHELERRAQNIGLIVAIGVADDDKKIMSYVKEQNPDVAIIALNTAEPDRLPYLQPGDALIPGDCQKTLPEMYRALSR